MKYFTKSFETENYIFVHSWIPTDISFENGTCKPWYQEGKTLTWMEDWRNANDVEWEEMLENIKKYI